MNWQQQVTAMPVEEMRDLAEQLVGHLAFGEEGDIWQITCSEILSVIKAHDIAIASGKITRRAHLVTLKETVAMSFRIKQLRETLESMMNSWAGPDSVELANKALAHDDKVRASGLCAVPGIADERGPVACMMHAGHEGEHKHSSQKQLTTVWADDPENKS